MTIENPPYDEMDPAVVGLVRAINSFPGLGTRSSHGGHNSEAFPDGQWYVTVICELDNGRPTRSAWMSLEFVAWACRDANRSGKRLHCAAEARPPFVTEPHVGRLLEFTIKAVHADIEPDAFAEFLLTTWDEVTE
jgi:hypothetical protein